MVHIGKNTREHDCFQGISAGRGQNSYRGLVKIQKSATHARNFSQCDSLLIGENAARIPSRISKSKTRLPSVEMKPPLENR